MTQRFGPFDSEDWCIYITQRVDVVYVRARLFHARLADRIESDPTQPELLPCLAGVYGVALFVVV